MSFNIREIADQMVRHVENNLDSAFLDYLMDNKPTLRRAATYRHPRQEGPHLYYWSALHAAARHGRLDMIDHFVKAGVTVEMQDECKRTPLWYAAAYAHSEMMAKLLSLGAKVKYCDTNGWTPLHVAARNGHAAIVRDLLTHDSNPKGQLVNQSDKAGFTVLHKAVRGEHVAIVELLLRHAGADPNRASHEDRITPLHLAADRENVQLTELLLRHSAEMNARTRKGVTPLMQACQRHQPALLRLLLQRGADTGLTTDNGWTALHMAAEAESSACVQLLLRRPHIEVDVKNQSGWTPFLVAARHGRVTSLTALLSAGADPCVLTHAGNSALHLAAMSDGREAVSFLLSHLRSPTAEWEVNAEGQTALHVAAERGSSAITALLLQGGAPVNLRDANDCSSLHLAARHRHVGTVKLLLSHGANPLHSLPIFRWGARLVGCRQKALPHGDSHSHQD